MGTATNGILYLGIGAIFVSFLYGTGEEKYRAGTESVVKQIEWQTVKPSTDLDGNGLTDLVAEIGDKKYALFALKTNKGVVYSGVEEMTKFNHEIAKFKLKQIPIDYKSIEAKLNAK